MSEVLIRCDNVSKKFCRDLKRSLWYGVVDSLADLTRGESMDPELRKDEFWANRDISFELHRGECLGVVGRNGAGKTTLLKMLNGIIKPDKGMIRMHGRVSALIALGAGFNPILTGRENVYVNGSVLGLKSSEIDACFDSIVDFAEMHDFIDAPVRSYSSGMQVRLGFSVAVNLVRPDVLILDEVLAVGDAAFRAKCEKKLSEIMKYSAVIFVSHTALHIKRLCDRILWLESGRMRGLGDTSEWLPLYESETSADAVAASLTHADSIRDVSLVSFSPPQAYGHRMCIEIGITSDVAIDIGAVVIGVVEEGSRIVAQANIEYRLNVANRTVLRLETDPLFLKDGNYSVNVAMYGDGYRDLVLRYHAIGGFSLRSQIDGVAAYHFQASATVCDQVVSSQ